MVTSQNHGSESFWRIRSTRREEAKKMVYAVLKKCLRLIANPQDPIR